MNLFPAKHIEFNWLLGVPTSQQIGKLVSALTIVFKVDSYQKVASAIMRIFFSYRKQNETQDNIWKINTKLQCVVLYVKMLYRFWKLKSMAVLSVSFHTTFLKEETDLESLRALNHRKITSLLFKGLKEKTHLIQL